MADHYRIGAFGTPCGGTNYTAKVLQSAGLRVGHETLRDHGIVCGFFLWGKKMGRIPNPNDYTFDHIVRVIRHPLKVAETLPAFVWKRWNNTGTPWFMQDCPDPRLCALRFWVCTHEHPWLEKAEYVVRIGTPETENDLTALVHALEHRREHEAESPITKKKRWEPLSWEGWKATDPDWAARGMDICQRFGLEPKHEPRYTSLAQKSNARHNADDGDGSNRIPR